MNCSGKKGKTPLKSVPLTLYPKDCPLHIIFGVSSPKSLVHNSLWQSPEISRNFQRHTITTTAHHHFPLRNFDGVLRHTRGKKSFLFFPLVKKDSDISPEVRLRSAQVCFAPLVLSQTDSMHFHARILSPAPAFP